MKIPDAARGRWRELLPAFGIDTRLLTGKHVSCPVCGGKDRFRFDDRDGVGSFYCAQCGAGDGFTLAMKATGKSFREVADIIAQELGIKNTLDPQYSAKPKNDQRKLLQSVWDGGRKPEDGSHVSLYLIGRVGCQWPSNAIREGIQYTTMIAKIIGADDKPVNLHVTYLTKDGQKADVTPNRKVLPGSLPEGCAIRLAPAAGIMGVAEGIETAISASLMFDMPVWACVNASLLAKWIPPDIAKVVYVFGDNDLNYTGQAAAYRLANRLAVQFKLGVEIRIPDLPGTDWNDIHKLKRGP